MPYVGHDGADGAVCSVGPALTASAGAGSLVDRRSPWRLSIVVEWFWMLVNIIGHLYVLREREGAGADRRRA